MFTEQLYYYKCVCFSSVAILFEISVLWNQTWNILGKSLELKEK